LVGFAQSGTCAGEHTRCSLGMKSLEIEVTHTFPFSNFSDAYQFTEKDGFIGKAAIET
jgi:hypothetical protein